MKKILLLFIFVVFAACGQNADKTQDQHGQKTDNASAEQKTVPGNDLQINNYHENDEYEEAYSEIQKAIIKQDVNHLVFLVSQIKDEEERHKEETNALFFAAERGNLAFAKHITIVFRIEPESAYDTYSNTLLHFAAQYNDIEFAKFLLSKNVDINQANESNITPVLLALQYDNVEFAKFLIKNGADINFIPGNSEPILLGKYYDSQYADIKLFIKAGANVNIQNPLSGTALLHLAAQDNNTEFADLLIRNNADINIKDAQGDTPLHYAVRYNAMNMVKLLAEKGADVNIANSNGQTTIFYAIEFYRMEEFNFLLSQKIEINKQDNYGNTALHIAAQKKAVDCYDLLIEHKADPSIRNKAGRNVEEEGKHIYFGFSI